MAGAAAEFRLALRWHPEWPFALIAAALWLLLLIAQASPTLAGTSALSVSPRGGLAFLCQISWPPDGGAATLSAISGWSVMVSAMMIPVGLPWIRHVGLNSIKPRRQRGMAIYAAAFIGCWIVVGFAGLAVMGRVLAIFGPRPQIVLALALLMAAVWHISPIRRRALGRCAWTIPLPPMGRAADLGCIRLGLVEARRCITVCGALMTPMIVATRTSILMMSIVTAIAFADQWTTVGFRWRRETALLLALAACALVVGQTAGVPA